MFELIRKIVKDHPLEVKYSESLHNFTVIYKDIAILYVGNAEECETFIAEYEQYLISVNQPIPRVS